MNDKHENTETDQDVSPAKALFYGDIVKSLIWPFPTINPENEEMLQMILESVDRFLEGREEEFRQWDESGAQPEAFIQDLRELGLFGLIIPEEYGGIGLSN